MPAAAPSPSRELLLRWLLALALFATLILFFSPSWGAFQLAARAPELQGIIETRRGVSVLQQMQHPGAPIADPLHAAIQWRLLFPAIGNVLNLPPPALFGLAHVGCWLVLGFIITLLRRRQASWTDTALIGLSLGAASWFFTSTGWLGYFDSWLALALLLVAFAETPWTVWLACLWAPWVDERFVMAIPLALFCRWLWHDESVAPRRAFDWKRETIVPLLLVAAFAGVRLGVLPDRSAGGATLAGYFGGKSFLDAPISRIALGVWEGLRAGWVFVGLAVILLGSGRHPSRGRAALLAILASGLAFVGLATAQDYSRSMTMLLPAALFGALLTVGSVVTWRATALRVAVLAGLLLPAHHVMNDRVNPIFYLYHELAALDSPPPTAMPELYELRAIHEMERGEFAQADADLALAMKLSRNPASPAKQRGILAASQQRWADALKYFSILAENDPQNPDAWFMCAQSHLALGNPNAAKDALQHATSLAPADWPTRPDVARFIANLSKR